MPSASRSRSAPRDPGAPAFRLRRRARGFRSLVPAGRKCQRQSRENSRNNARACHRGNLRSLDRRLCLGLPVLRGFVHASAHSSWGMSACGLVSTFLRSAPKAFSTLLGSRVESRHGSGETSPTLARQPRHARLDSWRSRCGRSCASHLRAELARVSFGPSRDERWTPTLPAFHTAIAGLLD